MTLLRSLLNFWPIRAVLLATPSGTLGSDGNPQAAPVGRSIRYRAGRSTLERSSLTCGAITISVMVPRPRCSGMASRRPATARC